MKKKTIIIISVIISLTLLIGICSYSCVNYFVDSVKKMQIVTEDLDSSIKKQITREGTNLYPQYSNTGDVLYYINRPSAESGNSQSQLVVYSTKTMKTINTIVSKNENVSFTTSVLSDKKILGYLKNIQNKDLCWYNIGDEKGIKVTDDKNNKTNPLVSPDGKWVSYVEEDEKNSRSNVCIIPSEGGKKIQLSNSDGMLSDVKIYSWSADSKKIYYISFLSLIVKSINGEDVGKIDLTGLNNFKNVLADPRNPDNLYLIARNAGGGLSYSIHIVSIKEKKYTVWKEDRSFWEMNYSISPDGSKIVYSDNVE